MYIIAEVGVHHEGDFALALAYIDAAKIAGADAVKFQTYDADELVTEGAEAYWDGGEGACTVCCGCGEVAQLQPCYHCGGSGRDPEYVSQRDALRYPSFTEAQYRELFDYARNEGIDLLSTPFSIEAATMLYRCGMRTFKIASGDITNLPLIRHVAGLADWVLLSTGGADRDEIDAAWDEISSVRVTLLHCSLAYPTPDEYANLGRIDHLGLTGYSDHTTNPLSCPLAVAKGATVIEKHFTLDKMLPGRDHYHAFDPIMFDAMVDLCHDAEVLCRYRGMVTEVEQEARIGARRSLVAARDIAAGETIMEADVERKRPGGGLPPDAV